MNRIYLDYASATPLDPRVASAMEPYLRAKFGNPSSLHREGQEAMAALDKSRETVMNLIGAKFNEVIFTSSATEANNLALRGTVKQIKNLKIKNQNDKSKFKDFKPRIIVSAIEHESILETAADLERDGVEVVRVPVDRRGLVDLEKFKKALNENTILVSIMYANNETGVVQNISEISKIIRNFRNSKSQIPNNKQISNSNDKNQKNGLRFGAWDLVINKGYPLFHTDAVQAFQYLDCNVDALGVDLMTLSSQKIYGPKGAGALYVRNLKSQIPNNKQISNSNNKKNSNLDLELGAWDLSSVKPMMTGGGQEFELRSGTENIPAIVGFAKAAELLSNSRELESRRVGKLRDYLWAKIKKSVPAVRLNGDAAKRLPNNLNVYFPGTSAEEMLIRLDMDGVAISAGSACAARSLEPSHVLMAMGFNEERAKGSVRFTLGRSTTKIEIDKLIKILRRR
ncbi:MAG: hypothetical protein A3B23_01450 [Candidatus Colwellbacteria bacterium RIFCSPLOWO2_01_FULL_48_10]|uniref:cysteine desulfurase n=2 Tax=Bacteria candidate phyla TaxID=1783234 RepID=A0A1F5P3R4_9BACT|nr:MAG: hypothetical protein A2846_04265 [Candidatus Doudnabacteria bacterium RIFCSPHIGHO2_01_FULL_49_9]OGY59077.1 MAG: hypothetical protein A3B23_01450 [Candidatus Colwellbacteria bacterium RIFCSPLOWO2_01_FULL_48_10]